MINLLAGYSIPSIRTIAISIAVGALLAGAVSLYAYTSKLSSKIKELETENAVLVSNNKIMQENNTVMKENMKRLATANHENWLTSQQLLAERIEAQKAINTLAASRANDKQTIERLNKRLEAMLKDPKNDGIVSPSLRETVREVQQSRTSK